MAEQTKADLAAENERLQLENDDLRERLDQLSKVADDGTTPGVTTGVTRPVPTEPSFGMTEGMRADLEQTGTATSPFTGKVYTAGENGELIAEEPATVADPPDSDPR